MTPEIAFAIRDGQCASARWEMRTTSRVLEAMPEAARDFRPEPRARSAFELAWHLVSSEVQMLEEIADLRFSLEERHRQVPATVAALVAWYQERFDAALARVQAMSAEQLMTPIDFYGVFNFPAVNYIAFVAAHSIHHRGQLSTYLRPMGGTVPQIYGGSADEPWQASTAEKHVER